MSSDDVLVPKLVDPGKQTRSGYVAPSGSSVPLSIVTGWLGSGKSTLIDRVLTHFGDRGKKVAVIQNEFSVKGVEEAVVIDNQGEAFEDFLELSNGCVCCTLKTDFISAIDELTRRKRFDYILVECSGMADPGPLASLFWVDQELEIGVHLDGIVCVVDTENYTAMATKEADTVRYQVSYADVILLNKMDKTTDAGAAALRAELCAINPTARLFSTTRSDVAISDVLGIEAYALQSVGSLALESHCGTAVGIASHYMELPGRVDLELLRQWIAEMLWSSTANIYRAKGVYFVPASSDTYYLQAVCSSFELDRSSKGVQAPSSPVCKMVVIGRDLDPAALEARFAACLASQ